MIMQALSDILAQIMIKFTVYKINSTNTVVILSNHI